MLKHYALSALALLLIPCVNAQLSFTNATTSMSNTTFSGGAMGVVDLNGDGRDDLAKLHMSKIFQVDYQNADGTFTLVDYGQVSTANQWGMSIGDISNNGHKDMISGGNGDGVHYLKIPAMGTSELVELNNGYIFMQCNNIADIDNDGHNDFFACHDVAAPKIWMNDGSGDLLFDGTVMDFTSDPASDMSGNYGSVWIDFDNDGDLDLYIAKCRQGVNDPNNPLRWNRLFVNNGDGTYTEMADEYGIQIRNQSWTADFGDIDNDGDLDLVITNHDHTIQLFENDGSGYFNEITAGSGLEINGFFLQSKFVDFDNDGYIDLLIAGGIERFFKNNGDNTFTQVSGLFPANKAMHSFAIGDLNNDGFMDVFASYGSSYVTPDPAHPDRLWLNNKNDNHWISVRLQGVESNRDAIGARVTIEGPWGTQIREVRAGESYGIVTTFSCNFGLGQHTVIPTMTINWPSGLEEVFTDVDVDQFMTIIEGTCISPTAEITSPSGTIVCSMGDPIILEAPEGYTYSWSTGEDTQTIEVTEGGSYTLTINSGGDCTGSTSIFIHMDPDETPTVVASSDTRFCEGGEVQLIASSDYPMEWNTGDTSASITVTEAGEYTVSVDGFCQAYTSTPVVVELMATPGAPEADDVNIQLGQQATLTATGENIQWYDQPIGGTVLATGNEYQTPALTTNTSYWVSSTIIHEGEVLYGGKEDNSTNGAYHSNATYYLIFEAYQSFAIRSVKVYANGGGNRTIALVDQADGNTVLTQAFNIPDGESRVQLDFTVPSSGSYALRVVGGNPQLWRDPANSGVSYPYELGEYGAITTSSAGDQLYYFFYDWEVSMPVIMCESPRTEVAVVVGPVGIDALSAGNDLQIWPNPADVTLMLSLGDLSGDITLEITDVLGRKVMSRNLNTPGADGLFQIDVARLSAGDYLVRVTNGEISQVRHVIIN